MQANKKPLPPQVRELALAYCRKVRQPILIGNLSVELGWWSNLRDTEALLEDLVYEGVLRPLTTKECQSFGVSFAYGVVDPYGNSKP
jgi:hypothetical protein